MPPLETHTLAVTPKPIFTPAEFSALAMAARVAAEQATADAKNQNNPSVAAIHQSTAVGYRQLAAKCDQAAKSHAP